MSLFRNSRAVITTVSCLRRTAATTSTPGGGTKVAPSTNMSEASRAADETSLAMKNAEQRGTTTATGSGKSAGTSQSSTGQSTSPYRYFSYDKNFFI